MGIVLSGVQLAWMRPQGRCWAPARTPTVTAGQAAGHFGAEPRHLGPDGLDHLLVSLLQNVRPWAKWLNLPEPPFFHL